jgi:segregation and condensation protein A
LAAGRTVSFRVQLDTFSGPLDLLLYLVRKHEVDISNIPVARVADQFLEHVAVLEQIDVDAVGDFLDLASALIEIKSQMVLPQQAASEPDEVEDPRQELVERLLEFKKYRDAAQLLEERGREWQERFPRAASDLPPRSTTQQTPEITGVELWDLVSAFGRVLRDKLAKPVTTSITYDDTPIHFYMRNIDQRVRAEGSVAFFDLFPTSVHKSTLVGMFLALLELVRYRYALAHQSMRYGDILIEPGPEQLHEHVATTSAGEPGAAQSEPDDVGHVSSGHSGR